MNVSRFSPPTGRPPCRRPATFHSPSAEKRWAIDPLAPVAGFPTVPNGRPGCAKAMCLVTVRYKTPQSVNLTECVMLNIAVSKAFRGFSLISIGAGTPSQRDMKPSQWPDSGIQKGQIMTHRRYRPVLVACTAASSLSCVTHVAAQAVTPAALSNATRTGDTDGPRIVVKDNPCDRTGDFGGTGSAGS
jgi:hypothetical protein